MTKPEIISGDGVFLEADLTFKPRVFVGSMDDIDTVPVPEKPNDVAEFEGNGNEVLVPLDIGEGDRVLGVLE